MANNNVRNRRVSMQQLEILWEFLNSHRDIATAYNRSLQAKEYSARKWREIAAVLNAQGDGAYKEGKMWSKYWVDFKAKLKKRNAALRVSMRRTGGGPSAEPPISEIEGKFLQILGEDFGQGLAGIRVDPFPETATTLGTDTPVSQSILVQIPHLQHEALPELEALPEPLAEERSEGEEELPIAYDNDSLAEEPVTAPSPITHHRRTRPSVISREDARRSLVQSARERTEAAVRSSAAMEGMQHSLAAISNGILSIQRELQDIKRILSNAVPRAGE